MEAWAGLVGVLIGAGITWAVAREERKHRVREARRAEKMVVFQRFLIHLMEIEMAEVNGPDSTRKLAAEIEEVWAPVVLLCEPGGPVLREIGLIKELTPETGLEKGTWAKMTRAMREEMGEGARSLGP